MSIKINTLILAGVSALLFCGLFYMEYSEYQNDMAYVEMCEIMGGKAVLGKRGTNQCLSVSSLLGAE